MKHGFVNAILIAAALLLSSGTAVAAESKPEASKAAPPAGTADKAAAAKKAAPAPKPVDINSASKADLKKLPGIGDAEADRIIAGRPYLSKARLVTQNIITEAQYEAIKRQIVAMQKQEPAAKPAAKKG